MRDFAPPLLIAKTAMRDGGVRLALKSEFTIADIAREVARTGDFGTVLDARPPPGTYRGTRLDPPLTCASTGRTIVSMNRPRTTRTEARRARGARLGFRVDARTKSMVERAARLERRNVTEFCLAALTAAAQQSIEHHSALVLSEADRSAFFDALIHPPKTNARLKRAIHRERVRVEP